MATDSKSLNVFFRNQGVYLFIALVVGAVFWAIGQPINPFTVILYSLCIGNFVSPAVQWLHVLYEKPSPYDWLIFLAVLCVVMFPVYALSSVIVWWLAPPTPQSLGHFLTTGWKMPFLITFLYGVTNFLYNKTKARLERRNVELQSMVQAGAARLEIHEEELQRAREIQQLLMPKEIPQLPGIAVATAWRPARTVGGDYFDVLRLNGDRLAICIADVSGKGVPAALLMANVQAALRASVRNLESPARVCGIMNGMLRESISANRFVTFFCAVLDANARTFRYCNAGHPYPILVSAGAANALDGGGAVLGVFPSWDYQDLSVNLKSGDRLLLFTDGITEAEDAQGEEFGVERVAAFGKANAAGSAAELNTQLLEQVSDFCGAQFEDDATLVVLAVN
ncbi:MAG TPA: PP2C family protein-serine/threonine phosphatase [Candidatus Eremiobacteraceae bacterium]|nr:PP2C family protein-serine/threonine phosphatase [Candidatus Eremiobacteraceae bacterium]